MIYIDDCGHMHTYIYIYIYIKLTKIASWKSSTKVSPYRIIRKSNSNSWSWS